MQLAFVVQLRPDIDRETGRFEGRVEHVDSGRAGHFRTVEEFLALLMRLPDEHSPVEQTMLDEMA